MKASLSLAALLTFATLLAAKAGEEPVPSGEKPASLKDVPKPVLATAQAKFPDAKPTEARKEAFSDGEVLSYTVILQLKEKGKEKVVEVGVKPDGKLFEVATRIDPKTLPGPVAEAIKKLYPLGQIRRCTTLVEYDDDGKAGGTEYRVFVTAPGGTTGLLTIKPDGDVRKLFH
jgi:hypothetical protein